MYGSLRERVASSHARNWMPCMIVERSAAAVLVGLVASLAVACGIAPATPGGDQPIGVRLQVEAKTDSGQPALGAQEMLQTGDRLAVIVNSDRLAVTVNG